MKKIKIDISSLKKFLVTFSEKILDKDSLLLFFAIFFSLLIGLVVFYQYNFLPQRKEIKIIETPFLIEEEVLSKILTELEQRENKFNQEELRATPDPFWPEQTIEVEQPAIEEGLTE